MKTTYLIVRALASLCWDALKLLAGVVLVIALMVYLGEELRDTPASDTIGLICLGLLCIMILALVAVAVLSRMETIREGDRERRRQDASPRMSLPQAIWIRLRTLPARLRLRRQLRALGDVPLDASLGERHERSAQYGQLRARLTDLEVSYAR